MNHSNNIIKKLLQKPAAVAALLVIGMTCLVAVFAYQLAPDNTPFANRMIVELGAKPPGFTKKILLLPKANQNIVRQNWTQSFSGTPSDYDFVPVNAYYFLHDKLAAVHYIDEQMQDTLYISYAAITKFSKENINASDTGKFIREHFIKTKKFYLGTDRYGRDILSRLLIGSRVSIAVGLVAVLLSISIGIILGCIAGYFGGIKDDMVMWFINILWAIPTLLLVVAITLTLGKGFWEIFIAIGLTMWVGAARLIRGQVKVIREMEYITAAKAIGLGDMRIMFRHILPNIAGPIMVIAASNFATAILLEAGLSFLGVGVQPPQPSWGIMIKEHYNFLISNRPMAAIIPGIAIMLLVYAFNILGNALRDVLDVRD